MSVPPQINATLTAIAAPGLSEDYDRPAEADDTPLWQGESGCYVREKVITSFGAELNRVLETSVYLDPDLVPIKSGHILTYKYAEQVFTRKIQNVVTRTLPGAPNYLVALLEITNAP